VSEHSVDNHMSTANLATVFSASVFREMDGQGPKVCLLFCILYDHDVSDIFQVKMRIPILKLLIQHAGSIGVKRERMNEQFSGNLMSAGVSATSFPPLTLCEVDVPAPKVGV
jgi:hypothetical protein